MTTFLWMLYLAFTLNLTIMVVHDRLYDVIHKTQRKSADWIITILCCILWSIWYFYYLN